MSMGRCVPEIKPSFLHGFGVEEEYDFDLGLLKELVTE